MRWIRAALALLLLAVTAVQAREIKVTIFDLDADDTACGLRFAAIRDKVLESMAIMKAVEKPDAAYELLVAIATVKRPVDCAGDVVVSVRRTVTLAANERFRTRDNKAALELCRHGGIVVSPIRDHERDFLKQVERSVMVCFGQLTF